MNRLRRFVLLAPFFGFLGVQGAEEPAAFRVSLFSVGAEVAQRDLRAGAAAFISRLDGRSGFAAREEKSLPRALWDDPLPEGKPQEKIALVAVHFGARTDWLAFGFNAAGDPAVAVRRPARQYDTQGIYPENIPPGDRQIDRNAGIELAADFGRAWSNRLLSGTVGCPVSLRMGEAENLEGMSLTPAEREGMRALFVAAALRQGFQPVRGQAEQDLTLRGARLPEGYRLALEMRDGRGAVRRVAARAHRESLFGYLERMLRAAIQWGDERILFMALNPAGGDLLGWREDRIYLDQNGALECWSVVEGVRRWERPKPERYRPRYGFRVEADGGALLFQYQPSYERIHIETGVGSRGSAASGLWPWSVARGREDQVFVAEGETLKAIGGKRNETVWSARGAGEWTAGPTVRDGWVWAGNEAGEMVCWRESDGHEVWRALESARWIGPLFLDGDLLIGTSREGVLMAFGAREGERRWRVQAPDTLLAGGLYGVGGSLLAADRSGWVGRLEVATGSWTAEWRAGEPAAGFAVVSDSLAVWTGRRGRLVLLRLPETAPLREMHFGALLRDGLLIAREAPAEWQTGDPLTVERGTLVLTADDEGFVYALPLP